MTLEDFVNSNDTEFFPMSAKAEMTRDILKGFVRLVRERMETPHNWPSNFGPCEKLSCAFHEIVEELGIEEPKP